MHACVWYKINTLVYYRSFFLNSTNIPISVSLTQKYNNMQDIMSSFELKSAMEMVVKACEKHRVIPGSLALSFQALKTQVAMGFKFFICCVDEDVVNQGILANLQVIDDVKNIPVSKLIYRFLEFESLKIWARGGLAFLIILGFGPVVWIVRKKLRRLVKFETQKCSCFFFFGKTVQFLLQFILFNWQNLWVVSFPTIWITLFDQYCFCLL
eukprot:TRINITY_DN2093_c0_g1_i3.p1 TRINITY_DN2093_c0_g1~~TRINITY_DN2093_c0_g1_i3.p1  ORF type:complete len:211 (-),score=4.29 TRINITY_DN2093_c0_g1_i3:125-757(-)